MSDTVSESLFDRTFQNVASAWRDIAGRIGIGPAGDPARDMGALEALMRDCVEARGGEVSARQRTAELGRVYLEMNSSGRRDFLVLMAHKFAVDPTAVAEAMAAFDRAQGDGERLAAERKARRALVPLYLKLLTQFNTLPEGVKFLADLRADLLALIKDDPYLAALDDDLHELLSSWFDVGFLDLRRITWDSSASLLEKLILYEAVHEITSWSDLRDRLDSDRRLYALFHPRMPEEPLAFVEVALVKGMSASIQTLLDEQAPSGDPENADSAIFYSISNTQRGLKGIAFGEYLIKMVVQQLARDLPRIKSYCTLSPVPGFRGWLKSLPASTLDAVLSGEEQEAVMQRAADHGSESADSAEAFQALLALSDWPAETELTELLESPVLRLAAGYFQQTRADGRPLDPVARFHLKNGARLERINWLGDRSPKGLKQSAGIMVNYRYLPDEIEANHEAYVSDGKVAVGPEVKSLMKRLKKTKALKPPTDEAKQPKEPEEPKEPAVAEPAAATPSDEGTSPPEEQPTAETSATPAEEVKGAA